jgi:hypothetical protein
MLRVVKLPVVAGACLIAGILIGAALTPVLAQQMSGTDGQVAVRSDYAVYLLTGGQRRWVATVAITDQEINAYPEGEPIFSGLAPTTGQVAAGEPQNVTPTPTLYVYPTLTPTPYAPASSYPGAQPPPNQNPYQPPANQPTPLPPHLSNQQPPGPLPSGSVGSTGSGGVSPGWNPTATPYGGQFYPTATPTPYVYGNDPNLPSSEIDPNLPLEVTFEGSTMIERGGTLRVALRTRPNAQCEVTIRWPDGSEAQQPGRTADGSGRCELSMPVGPNAPTGMGLVRATVRDAGLQSRQSVQFQVVYGL